MERELILEPSLVLYLPLYELDGASIQSRDVYGHLCTVTGALWRPDGRWFDGSDDRITVPRHTALEPAAFTLEAWLNFHEDGGNQTIFSKDNTSHVSPYYSYHFRLHTGNLFLAWNNGTTQQTLSDTEGAPATGVWIHVATTYELGRQRIYRDGEITKSGTATDTITYYDTELVLGSARNIVGYDMGAVAGEFRIYSRALTPLEVKNNYLATKWRYQ